MSKTIKLTREQLVRRLILIQGDVDSIIQWCKTNGVNTSIDNHNGSSHDTFITNIMIASDVDVDGNCDEDNSRVETEWVCKETDDVLPFMSFEGSWGSIDCDRDGYILAVHGDKEINGESNYLYGIARINIDEYCEFLSSHNITHGECDDILAIGFWRKDGVYETPDEDWRKNIFGEKDSEEAPTYQCQTPQTHDKVKQIIDLLKTLDNGDCVDGETMQYILGAVGMEGQMLSQLARMDIKETLKVLSE